MAYKRSTEPHRYSVSLVTQGNHRFYTLTMPSEVLANTCYVTTRDEDPKKGFQRVLDSNRAQQIADYIDMGFGTIPTSIRRDGASLLYGKVIPHLRFRRIPEPAGAKNKRRDQEVGSRSERLPLRCHLELPRIGQRRYGVVMVGLE
jgi:hypothetical protein